VVGRATGLGLWQEIKRRVMNRPPNIAKHRIMGTSVPVLLFPGFPAKQPALFSIPPVAEVPTCRLLFSSLPPGCCSAQKMCGFRRHSILCRVCMPAGSSCSLRGRWVGVRREVSEEHGVQVYVSKNLLLHKSRVRSRCCCSPQRRRLPGRAR